MKFGALSSSGQGGHDMSHDVGATDITFINAIAIIVSTTFTDLSEPEAQGRKGHRQDFCVLLAARSRESVIKPPRDLKRSILFVSHASGLLTSCKLEI